MRRGRRQAVLARGVSTPTRLPSSKSRKHSAGCFQKCAETLSHIDKRRYCYSRPRPFVLLLVLAAANPPLTGSVLGDASWDLSEMSVTCRLVAAVRRLVAAVRMRHRNIKGTCRSMHAATHACLRRVCACACACALSSRRLVSAASHDLGSDKCAAVW
jgi:hypothetical protein